MTQVLTAADSAAAPATNVPVCGLSNAQPLSPKFIGQGTPLILHPIPYETCKYHPFLYMNLYTILLPEVYGGGRLRGQALLADGACGKNQGGAAQAGRAGIRPSRPNPTRWET